MLSDEVGEERSETTGNIPDGVAQGLEHGSRRVRVERNEEDQECDAKPGENLLDHGGPSPPLRVTVIAAATLTVSVSLLSVNILTLSGNIVAEKPIPVPAGQALKY
jgi:hypothetical protein